MHLRTIKTKIFQLALGFAMCLVAGYAVPEDFFIETVLFSDANAENIVSKDVGANVFV